MVGPYTDIVWNNLNFGGLFNTPDGMYVVQGNPSAQAYSGDESAPTFLTGTYPGMNIGTGADATVVISSGGPPSTVPEPRTLLTHPCSASPRLSTRASCGRAGRLGSSVL